VVTRYLHYKGFDLRPKTIIERSFPDHITILPTIVLNDGVVIEGLDGIVKYYEKEFEINHLVKRSRTFHTLNPNYKITDRSTHKGVVSG
jgi:hypothetical protein